MTSLNYRPATPEDLDLLLSIEKSAFSRPFDNTFSESEILKMVSRAKSDDGSLMLIYEGQDVVGYYNLLDLSDEIVELESLAILPKFQSQGFGGLSLGHIIKEVGSKSDLQLTVHPKNTAGLIVYLKNRFVPVEYKENCYGDGQPRLLMKRLKS